ncbi:MAG: hypothetical protein WAS51_13895 [Ilumatobacteraceae bacterium]
MRRSVSTLLLWLASLLFGAAMTGWWMQQTVFDPSNTESVTGAVLDHESVRTELTRRITEATAEQLGVDRDEVAFAVDRAAQTPAGAELLAQLVVDSHARLIGERDAPVQITPAQLVVVLGDDRAALLPAILLPVPRVSSLAWFNSTLDDLVLATFLGALGCALLALVVHPDKARMLKILGLGLVGVAVLVGIIGWVLPTFVLPVLTDSPWAKAIPEIAHSALSLLVGLSLVSAGLGVAAIIAGVAWGRSERAF